MIRSRIEVSGPCLRHNLTVIRRWLAPSVRVMAVVKANAYGHGLEAVVTALRECQLSAWAVAQPQEALALRQQLPKAEILVFGGCLPGEEEYFRRYNLITTIFSLSSIPQRLRAHLKIDTGMTRMGIPWEQAGSWLADSRLRQHQLQLTGLYTHFSSADLDSDFTRLQLRRFLKASQGFPAVRHAANSAALVYPKTHLDMVRVGLALYGIDSSGRLTDLRPALQWKTRILAIQEVPAQQGIGYGQTFRTTRNSRIGILPVGYADGYPRALSNRAQVRVGGALAPVVGRVSMDLTAIDLTEIPQVHEGDPVVLLEGNSDSPLSAVSLAKLLKTIPYELLVSIGTRAARVLVESD